MFCYLDNIFWHVFLEHGVTVSSFTALEFIVLASILQVQVLNLSTGTDTCIGIAASLILTLDCFYYHWTIHQCRTLRTELLYSHPVEIIIKMLLENQLLVLRFVLNSSHVCVGSTNWTRIKAALSLLVRERNATATALRSELRWWAKTVTHCAYKTLDVKTLIQTICDSIDGKYAKEWTAEPNVSQCIMQVCSVVVVYFGNTTFNNISSDGVMHWFSQ